MPELPEVEVIRRGLQRLLNTKIMRVEVKEKKAFIGDPQVILNTKITQVGRRGKALIIDFENEMSMMIHLRMTGQVIWREGNAGGEDFAGGHPTDDFFAELPNRMTRVVFEFDKGKLFFNDQRKFGFVKVMKTAELAEDWFLASLAPEPTEMKAEEFYQRLQRHGKANVKAMVLNQKVIAGVGNIYADEGLFFAGVHPERRAGTLTRAEAKQLLEGFVTVMAKSIELGGSTMATYVNAEGKKGDYLTAFAEVFGRQGQKCRRCGGEIKKIRVAGRGTHVCDGCQK